MINLNNSVHCFIKHSKEGNFLFIFFSQISIFFQVLTYLKKVENLGLDQALLSETKIGITVNKFRRKKGPVATTAARIIENWMEMVKRNLNATQDESKDDESKGVKLGVLS